MVIENYVSIIKQKYISDGKNDRCILYPFLYVNEQGICQREHVLYM